MTDYSEGVVVEAIKKGLTQSRTKDGDWYDVKFQIHPDDAMNTELAKWPLGTRVGLVITRLDDSAPETPADEHSAEPTQTPEKTERLKGGPRSQRAGILCNDPAFQRWFLQEEAGAPGIPDAQATADLLRYNCGIQSRAELDHNETAGRIFDQIASDFYASQQGRTDEALREQRDRV